MAVLTNETGLRYTVEDSIGVVSGDEVWVALEPNDYSTLGATITTVSRDPISNTRMAKKGTTTDLDSAVEFDADLTESSFNDFASGFLFAEWNELENFEPTGISASGFAHAALASALPVGTLVYSRGNSSSANNGLSVVNGSPTTTLTPTDASLSTETPPDGSRVNVCGVEAASGDIEVDSDGNLTSSTLDFTSLDLVVGMMIFVGDEGTDNTFATAGASSARIKAIEVNKLTLDKKGSSTWATDSGAGKTIRLFFGDFLRNVSLDDGNYVNRTYQFESRFTGIESGDATQYEYSIGNQANSMTLNMPLTDKCTVGFSFVGLDTEVPTGTRKSGTFVPSYDTDAYNTTNDFVKLSLTKYDGTPMAAYFKDLTLVINNNVTPEKVIGRLGAKRMGIGMLDITGTTQVLFTDTSVIAAVRDNETVTLDFCLSNDDGALHFDIPAMTLGGAGKNYARNETVKLDIDSKAFEDGILGYVLGVTNFAYRPAIDEQED